MPFEKLLEAFEATPWWQKWLAYSFGAVLVAHLFLEMHDKKSRGVVGVGASLCYAYRRHADGFDARVPQNLRNDDDDDDDSSQGSHLARVELPVRAGGRPDTVQRLCHYQASQLPPREWSSAVYFEIFGPACSLLRRVDVCDGESEFEIAPSRALFVEPVIGGSTHDALSRAEFAYLQHIDRAKTRDVASWHLTLHPRDARLAVAAGWAEYHPLAGMFGADEGFVMVYAPRDAAEVEVLVRLLHAAYHHKRAAVDASIEAAVIQSQLG
jgi:hypothetical protein